MTRIGTQSVRPGRPSAPPRNLVWPNLFLVGAPRCGTTSLFSYLAAHPAVLGAAEKEPHYYAADLPRERKVTDERAYRALFAGASGERWLLEASTLYLYSERAPGAILRDSPEARILISLRNPVELMDSWHRLLLAGLGEDLADLGQAVAVEADRRNGRRLPTGVSPEIGYRYDYTGLARLAPHVERWLQAFGRERVHVLVLEDVQGNPAAERRRLHRFLGLEDAGIELPHLNGHRELRASALAGVLRPSGPARALAARTLPRPVRRRVWFAVRTTAVRSSGRPPIDPELRARLERELEPDVLRLGSLIGRDLRTLWFSRGDAV